MQLRDRLTHLQTVPSPETAHSPDASAGGRDSASTVQHETARQLADQRQNAAAQWDALLSTIRARPGLADFLMPPAIAQLQRQAGNGPIIFVIPDDSRCDALILTPDPDQPVQHIPLPDLSQDNMIEQANRLLEARRTATSWVSQRKAQNDLHEVLCWLWDTTAAPILDALGHTAIPEPGQAWPRVWWCPVGLMAYLPLHAAGHHYDTAAGSAQPRTVLDRVVSSYTSTIGALGYAREQSLSPGTPANRALIVAMPVTPGATELPAVEQEVRRLTRLLPDATLLKGHHATRDAVLAALPSHSLAHFCCHGTSDWDDPSRSHLLLHDHATKPLTVTAISGLHLTSADLACLSACRTADTSPSLADEAIHITAAFQLAGYRNVIGTLWSVYDQSATSPENSRGLGPGAARLT